MKSLRQLSRLFLIKLSLSMAVLTWAIYKIALTDTIELIQNHAALKQSLEENQFHDIKLKRLESELHDVALLLGASNEDASNMLIQTVTVYVSNHQLVLKSLPPARQYQYGDVHVNLQSFQVSGSLVSILRLIDLIERDSDLGKVVSIDFGIEFDQRRKKRLLNASVCIQNLKIKVYES
ncbi:MAG: hypothetical protein RIE58_07790 [Vicingaceae bacterium]